MTALDVFGAFLMRRVRDKAIGDWERILTGQMKGATAEQVQTILSERLDPDQADSIRWLVPQIVDTTLHHLLWALDEEGGVKVSVEEGAATVDVKSASDGLPGELYGDHGWVARFSRQSGRGG